MANRQATSKAGLQSGVCIVCGQEAKGVPANADAIIRVARRFRAILKSRKHTVACPGHLNEARARRALFERRQKEHVVAALAAFLLLLGLPAMWGRFSPGYLFPAIFCAIFIYLLSYARYSPDFPA